MAVADVKTLSIVERQTSEDTCCDPVCGPDVCGPLAEVEYIPLEKEAEVRFEQCCDPDCGPDTCGC